MHAHGSKVENLTLLVTLPIDFDFLAREVGPSVELWDMSTARESPPA